MTVRSWTWRAGSLLSGDDGGETALPGAARHRCHSAIGLMAFSLKIAPPERFSPYHRLHRSPRPRDFVAGRIADCGSVREERWIPAFAGMTLWKRWVPWVAEADALGG
jgi:hypothetical protein